MEKYQNKIILDWYLRESKGEAISKEEIIKFYKHEFQNVSFTKQSDQNGEIAHLNNIIVAKNFINFLKKIPEIVQAQLVHKNSVINVYSCSMLNEKNLNDLSVTVIKSDDNHLSSEEESKSLTDKEKIDFTQTIDNLMTLISG